MLLRMFPFEWNLLLYSSFPCNSCTLHFRGYAEKDAAMAFQPTVLGEALITGYRCVLCAGMHACLCLHGFVLFFLCVCVCVCVHTCIARHTQHVFVCVSTYGNTP